MLAEKYNITNLINLKKMKSKKKKNLNLKSNPKSNQKFSKLPLPRQLLKLLQREILKLLVKQKVIRNLKRRKRKNKKNLNKLKRLSMNLKLLQLLK